MITKKNELIATINGIIQLKYADTESKMMCINGLMQGHGVTWKAVSRELPYPFLTTQDYFIHQVNSGAFGPFAFYDNIEPVCSMCMDFTLMEAGNRVNMAENNGPY